MPFTPSRKLRPEVFQDPSFLSLPVQTRYLMLGLLEYVDGHGRENANLSVLRETFFEFDDAVTQSDVATLLLELDEAGWLIVYQSGKRTLMEIPPERMQWVSHIEKRAEPLFPPPPESARRPPDSLWMPSGLPRAEGKGGGSGYGAWMEDPDMPPPVGCHLHPHGFPLGNCGGCASARKIHEGYLRGEVSRETAIEAHRPSTSRATPLDEDIC